MYGSPKLIVHFQERRQRFRRVKDFAQGHTARTPGVFEHSLVYFRVHALPDSTLCLPLAESTYTIRFMGLKIIFLKGPQGYLAHVLTSLSSDPHKAMP